MSEKRRDSKGWVLRNGEIQRPDGKYEFKYTDAEGGRSVYSWRLVNTDSLPPGKYACEPPRDIEKRIRKDIEDGIDSNAARKTTLNSIFDAYIEMKFEIRLSTRTHYKYMYTKYVRDGIGAKNIASLKNSDIKRELFVTQTRKKLRRHSNKSERRFFFRTLADIT